MEYNISELFQPVEFLCNILKSVNLIIYRNMYCPKHLYNPQKSSYQA